MKILLLSDTHLGFSSGGERWEDAFLALKEALQEEADLILLGGDVFDTRTPTVEAFSRAMELFLKTSSLKSDLRVSGAAGKKIKNIVHGVPVVAIHGNHERRVKGLVNPVEALEMGGFLIHLHCNGVLLEKNGERISVQGMSAVPEQYAPGVLEEFNPKPVPDSFNIFMFHQNLERFVRSEKQFPKSLLPEGFDLYICGDIHESHKTSFQGKPLILPGSAVATQINKDSRKPRIYALIDTKTQSIDFIPFKNQRKIFYEEFEAREETEKFLRETLKEEHPMKPIIKIKSPTPLDELKSIAGEKTILMGAHEKEIPSLTIEEQKFSAQESGKQILEKNLKKLDLDPKTFQDIFELLLEKKQDEALILLRHQAKG